jgi:hypothetical protein
MALPNNIEKLINGRTGYFLKEMHLKEARGTGVTMIKD